MMLIDTHAHLNYPPLVSTIDTLIERANKAGVGAIVVPSTDVETSLSTVDICNRYPQLFGAVGIHPSEAVDVEQREINQVKTLLKEHPEIVAIGEVGLDFYHEQATAKAQERVFREMIDLAYSFEKPMIIHSREAFAETQVIIKESGLGPRSVIHCFTGDYTQAKAWLDLGCLISLTAIITYKKNTDLREMVAQLPLDRLMIETDAPYLPPEGLRGELCEPAYVVAVAECLAEVMGVTLEQVAGATTATAKQFFGLPL